MGKKSKKNQSMSPPPDTTEKSKKRKKKFVEEPAAKRAKNDSDEEDGNYQKRFKFVLAPPQQESDEEAEEIQPVKKDKKKKKNGKMKNAKEISTLAEVYNNYNDDSDDELSSSDGSWMDDDEFDSLSDEEDSQMEWETDTDYSECEEEESEYSFNESDCDEVSGSEDPDFVPDVEDKYVKKGDAILRDAKGLDIAFGDSNESQIIDINDLPVEDGECDEEVPKLVNENGEIVEEEPTTSAAANKVNSKIPEIQRDEEEELDILNAQLLKRVTFYDCQTDQGVVIKLNQTIHFLGILEIRPLVNGLQVNGYSIATGETLKATSISRADYYLNLSPVITENSRIDKNQLKEDLKKLLPASEDIDEIINSFNPQKEVLVHLQRVLPNSTIQMLKTYNPYAILPHKNMLLKNSPSPSSEFILTTKFFASEENPRLNCYRTNEDWKYVEVKSNSRVIVVGGKNVGKSALSQFLINQNIKKYKKILLIDLDIGQPICGPAQTVSATLLSQPLIGAGYLSNLTSEKCYLYGDKSIMISPFKYVECVRRLVNFCRSNENYQNIPWIINTMGYQKGFGLQLISLLIRIIQPSDVVQIQHANSKYNFQSIINEELVNNCAFSFFNDTILLGIKNAFFTTHVLDSLVNNNTNIQQEGRDNGGSEWISNATEKRKMSLLAQLGKLMSDGQTYLNEVVPHRTAINRIRMVVMDEEYENSAAGANLDLFNGNLVYLCHSADNDDLLPLDANSILECHGVGLVRAIDKIHGFMYILMPQHDDKLRSIVDIIAIGNMPLPSEILLKQNFGVDGSVPHVTFFKDRNMKKYINKRNIKDCF